ncbi:peptidase [Mariniblastus sp.]|nr:peptidase [Mariniblastus sp.]
MLASFKAPLATAILAVTLLAVLPVQQIKAQGSVPDATRDRPAKINRPVVIEMYGEIDGKLTTYFKSRFEQAKSANADLLIIDIDSPGGLKIESLEMARMLRDCDWAYTVAVVTDEAISGAALISIGCDEIYIDPNAKFGDIGEIQFDMEEFAFRLIEPKIESYLSRDARDLAESKGRPADLAEAMVDKEVLVYRRPKEGAEGEFEFTSARTDEEIKPDEPWELIPETGPERFLTVSGQRAKELEIAQGFASSVDELADDFQYDASKLRRYHFTATDTFVHSLNQPFFTGLLILIGLLALYIEASAPGIGIGGLVAGLCAVLFFWSRFLTGTSGWLEVILFLAGLTFIALELFVIPGFGLPGLSGIVLVFASILLASQSFVVPETSVQWNTFTSSALVMLTSGFLFLIAAVFISRRLGTLPFLNRLVLAGPDSAAADDTNESNETLTVAQELELAVGDIGLAESVLRPAGRATFEDRSVNVVSDGSYIEVGESVKIVRISGNIIQVAQT